MKTLWNSLWNLFFPKCCVVCGKPLLQTEEYLCLHCLKGLPRTNMHLQIDNEVEKNFWGKIPVQKASAFLYYTKGGDVRPILYELKYYGNKEIGNLLGRCMAKEILPSGFFRHIDYILPVPLHPKREKERGYNQSEWLAKGISNVTEIPLVTHLLSRSSYSSTQTHKTRIARFENMQGLFQCSDPEMLKGKHILLVDDVLTTGATLVATADALKGTEGLRISILTLALAGHD